MCSWLLLCVSLQRLFKREVEPPFRPAVSREFTVNFDPEFTSQAPVGESAQNSLFAVSHSCGHTPALSIVWSFS